eukprot:161102-Pyramimonas_sp.AAC.1
MRCFERPPCDAKATAEAGPLLPRASVAMGRSGREGKRAIPSTCLTFGATRTRRAVSTHARGQRGARSFMLGPCALPP